MTTLIDATAAPAFGSKPMFGVDTIRLAVTLPAMPTLRNLRTRQHVDPLTGAISTTVINSYEQLSAGGFVNVRPVRGGASAVVEFSVPRAVQGHNVWPVPAGRVIELIAPVAEEISDLFGIKVELAGVGVRRIDVVRDFEADGAVAADLLHRLSVAKIAGAPPIKTFASRRFTGVQTLSVGNGERWQATLYHKGEEVLADAQRHPARWTSRPMAAAAREAGGRLRYELRLRAILREIGINTVSDLDEELLQEQSRRYWARCRFGAEMTTSALQRAIIDAGNAGKREKRVLVNAIALLVADAVGAPVAVSHNTRDLHRSVLRRHGVDRAVIHGALAGAVHHLDYDTGRLVHD